MGADSHEGQGILDKVANNLFVVQNLKMALTKANVLKHINKAFSY